MVWVVLGSRNDGRFYKLGICCAGVLVKCRALYLHGDLLVGNSLHLVYVRIPCWLLWDLQPLKLIEFMSCWKAAGLFAKLWVWETFRGVQTRTADLQLL